MGGRSTGRPTFLARRSKPPPEKPAKGNPRKVGVMNRKTILIAIFSLSLALPAFAGKKHGQRALIEKMEAVPCGAKERGLSGLGSVWASIGATDIHTDEKLCPQYELKTDEMEYHVRPLDHKHPRLLPVGQESELRISKDVIVMRIPDGDHKMRRYQVVSMKPIDHSDTTEVGAYKKYDKPQTSPSDKPVAQVPPATKPY